MKKIIICFLLLFGIFCFSQDGTEYFYKALDLESKGFLNEAIQMYGKVLEVFPDSFEIYNNRGIVYKKLKKYDQAIMDYTSAIKLKPDFAFAYNNRAISYYFIKEYKKACDDFESAIKYNPSEGFYYFLHLTSSLKISKEALEKSMVLLNKNKDFIKDRWTYNIADFLIGKIKAKDLINKSDYNSERLCEAYFYIGLKYLISGKKFGAKSYFKKCLKTKQINFIEYELAQMELKKKK